MYFLWEARRDTFTKRATFPRHKGAQLVGAGPVHTCHEAMLGDLELFPAPSTQRAGETDSGVTVRLSLVLGSNGEDFAGRL